MEVAVDFPCMPDTPIRVRVVPHQIAEQVRAVDDGKSRSHRRGKLRIVHGDRSRINHRVGPPDVFRPVRISTTGNTPTPQAATVSAVRVRSDPASASSPLFLADKGKARHADAADPHKKRDALPAA